MIMCQECSICLNPVRKTRSTKVLNCGHMYHNTCIDNWILSGGNTCPTCRDGIKPAFKITINIENVSANNNFTDEITDEDVINMLISRFGQNSELSFDIDNLEELNDIISDFGIDINTSVLNAE